MLLVGLTRHLQESNKVAEESGVGEVMLEYSVDGNVEQFIKYSNGKVGVVQTQPISCTHTHIHTQYNTTDFMPETTSMADATASLTNVSGCCNIIFSQFLNMTALFPFPQNKHNVFFTIFLKI